MQTITDNGGAAKASYIYNADGTKVSVRNASGYGYDYLGSLVYQTDALGTRLESALFGGGRIRNNYRLVWVHGIGNVAKSTYEPEYYLTDHLGSTRVVVNSDNVVCARNDYYPLGGRWNPDGEAATNRWQFNGKESQQDFGLNFPDYSTFPAVVPPAVNQAGNEHFHLTGQFARRINPKLAARTDHEKLVAGFTSIL